ncbi:hypothetical protein HMPREF1624_08252 [Sporothrix schenckii ATCC 58251]|uniref:Uncharacterized protein n=1 Tax=Sporothrix schenckii (strain ATCC 58251 / de Perez 2211183) TaxID=1391915 RepID=U7PKZ2_SPOS1|nr:hypothetical protein HMPREF1624_08252 [Sporothrix schenckii ATCC 58251]
MLNNFWPSATRVALGLVTAADADTSARSTGLFYFTVAAGALSTVTIAFYFCRWCVRKYLGRHAASAATNAATPAHDEEGGPPAGGGVGGGGAGAGDAAAAAVAAPAAAADAAPAAGRPAVPDAVGAALVLGGNARTPSPGPQALGTRDSRIREDFELVGQPAPAHVRRPHDDDSSQ